MSSCASKIIFGPNEFPECKRQLLKVGTVIIHGVRIVSLIMEAKERLCLAQISNTLLKEYSYNEIHNRRVALGKFKFRILISK